MRGAAGAAEMARVRHHTSDDGLEGIRTEGAIHVSRGWGSLPPGIHLEIEPFGTTSPYRHDREGTPSPKAELGLLMDGAYIEFDVPPGAKLLVYSCGPRNTALIPTDRPFALQGLNPVFIKVRRYFWEIWRARPE